ncbi:MAG: hypothetical protein K8S54_08390 [Spirochaetia bacterium]|nr:hypothetical protein [Spirochaetia bacterium]
MDRTQAFRKRLENSGFEIWFGVAFDYEKRIAVWFRYSALHRPGRPPRSAVWLSFFDQKNGTNVVRTSGFDQGIVQKGETYSVGHSSFSQNHVQGTIDDIHWNLACTHAHEAESHVPEFVMNSPLVKTKSIVVSPFCGFSGIVKIGKRELNLNASGCYTHIWGTERVPELYWCFVPQFDNTDIGMEFFAVRPKPFLPLIKFITIREGSKLIHQHSLWRSARARFQSDFPEFKASGAIGNGTFDLECRMAEPATAYIYVDPSGSNRYINQNDASYARLILGRAGQRQELISNHRAAVEFHGMKPWAGSGYINPYEN